MTSKRITASSQAIGKLESCPKGTYAVGIQTNCTFCPSGFYQDNVAQVVCMACNSSVYNGLGANAAIHLSSNDHTGLPFCALFEELTSDTFPSNTTAPSSTSTISTPSSTTAYPSSSLTALLDPTSPPVMSDMSNAPSIPSATPSATQNVSTTPASVAPSTTPSINLNTTSFMDVCTNSSTIILHNDCVDCPVDARWSVLLAYGLTILLLAGFFQFLCPAYLFFSLDYFQTIGLLSLIQNVQFPQLLNHILHQTEYWAAFDWLGIIPCLTHSIQGNRMILVALPLLIATIPPHLARAVLWPCCCCCKNYTRVEEWVDQYTHQWAILVLLLTLQSVAVTVADAVMCKGVDGGLFCLTSHNWIDRGVPFVALLMGVLHLACVSIIIWRKRAVSTSIIQRIFHYWWWPFDFMIRKVAVVVIIFIWSSSIALNLVVVIAVVSGLAHLCLRPYRDDLRPGRARSLVSICFMLCFPLLSAVHALQERSMRLIQKESFWAMILGFIMMALMSGSFALGLLWYVIKRPSTRVTDDAPASRDERIRRVLGKVVKTSKSKRKQELRVFDEKLYAELDELQEQTGPADLETGKRY